MTMLDFSKNIDDAALVVGKTWPLYSFVTSNPLSGYEEMSFEQAIKQASNNLGHFTLPSASMYRQAWQNMEIEEVILKQLLSDADFNELPEFYLHQMEQISFTPLKNTNHVLDAIVCKWLSVFLDEGIAEWEMPNKKNGFYAAWRKLAPYDKEINIKSINQIPNTAQEALNEVLADYSLAEQLEIFKCHLAALPGYTGFIKYRIAEHSLWQANFPISLQDYLGMRLWVAKNINAPILVNDVVKKEQNHDDQLKYIWLNAWEKTYQKRLIKKLNEQQDIKQINSANQVIPKAQMVFCIDTRSELIRKQIELKGNYETFGYAGFFGLATDYVDLNTGYVRKSCPPIVASAYQITECAQDEKKSALVSYKNLQERYKFVDYLTTRMKNMLPSAFGYVEGTGLFYGFRLIARTIFPSFKTNESSKHEHICEPAILLNTPEQNDSLDISLQEKVAIVKSAFDLLGWTTFAPLVVFVGHGSHSANNPFASSLDCGACAASPGRHNARMLAKMANLSEVRDALSLACNIQIPENTLFIGAEHDTTTDEIILFDADVPNSHLEKISLLKVDLKAIQQNTISKRVGMINHDIKKSLEKATNWSETRPEWGLARNAGFIVGPRQLTAHVDLNSRCFLHSYNWQLDENGTALETIMQGPMVVTQWINSHYYFATVDNDNFGGGSKITQNVVGKFAVVQGNGGDLKIGLPLQSVKSKDDELFHQPLRLSVVIQAPRTRVNEILDRNLNLKELLQNKWVYLLVMDPLADNQTFSYQTNGAWSLLNLEEITLATAV